MTVSVIDSSSSRALDANIDQFLSISQYLGTPVLNYGKASVMQLAYDNNDKIPKFNKYSGVTEWNNCIFLWVNHSNNEFYENGKHIQWYGGSKMDQDSPIIQKIINNSLKILLFLRKENENYVCLGDLKWVRYDTYKYPVEFIFELLQFELLIKYSKYFQSIIN